MAFLIPQPHDPPPLVLDYLKTHTFRELESAHGVKARASASGDKVSLSYDLTRLRSGDRLAEECRGLVLGFETPVGALQGRERHDGAWKELASQPMYLLAWPMRRFANASEGAVDAVDWTDKRLRVYDKLDGTLIIAYYDFRQSRWQYATRGVPEGDVPINEDNVEIGSMTFAQLFEQAAVATLQRAWEAAPPRSMGFSTWAETLSEWRARHMHCDTVADLLQLHPSVTYCFELTSPHNRIGVVYEEPGITLLAARYVGSLDHRREPDRGGEYDVTLRMSAWQIGDVVGAERISDEPLVPIHPLVPTPKVWLLGSLAHVVAFADAQDPTACEGVVVVDSQFRRLKVKNKQWALRVSLKESASVSRRSMVVAILTGTHDDIVPLLPPPAQASVEKLAQGLVLFTRSVDKQFAAFKDEAASAEHPRKRFAELVNTTPGAIGALLFPLFSGHEATAFGYLADSAKKGRLSSALIDRVLEQLPATPDLPEGEAS